METSYIPVPWRKESCNKRFFFFQRRLGSFATVQVQNIHAFFWQDKHGKYQELVLLLSPITYVMYEPHAKDSLSYWAFS